MSVFKKAAMRALEPRARAFDPERLWTRHGFALAAILAVFLVGYIASGLALRGLEKDAELVNASGMQRALSQRMLHLADRLERAPDHQTFTELMDVTSAFALGHDRLSSRNDLSPQLRALYFDEGAGRSLDAMSQRYIRDARLLLAGHESGHDEAIARMRDMGPGALLQRLDEAVSGFEAMAAEHIVNARRARRTALIVFGLALGLLALLVFWPLQRNVSAAFGALRQESGDREQNRLAQIERNHELQETMRQAERDALHDALTDLPNRRYLDKMLDEHSERCETGGGLAVLHIDLDGFKQVNDTLGHAAGDYVLQVVGRELRKQTRDTDFVARVGGDEFVIVAPSNGDPAPLHALSRRLVEALSKPIRYEGELCHFGASIGIDIGISCDTGDKINPEKLLANADMALYKAKEHGKGRFEFFTPSIKKEVEGIKQLSDDLLGALEEGQFFPVYQPQIDAHTGKFVGVEALARWRHPKRGTLAPAAFLNQAEQLGVLRHLDNHIMSCALRERAKWMQVLREAPRLSVNVSAGRLTDPDFVDHALGTEAQPGELAFEIVESTFIDQAIDQVKWNIDRIKELGFDLEIDDFGTGHASIMGVIAIGPHRLKIARELIDPIVKNPEQRRIINGIIEIARTLGAEVTAEGVETAEHAAIARDLGCNILQGYYFARPMPSDELIAFLEEKQHIRLVI